MTSSSFGRTVRSLPVRLPIARCVALTLAFSAASLSAAPLAAQTPLTIAPDSVVAIRVTTRVVSSGALSPALTEEIYVAAFRSSARQWCAAGSATGLDDALASTRSIIRTNIAEADQAAVERAVVAAHGELSQAGGCSALSRPASVVVVDRFEGHPWNTPRRVVAPRDRGTRSEEGYTVVTRRAKIGTRRSHRVAAEADFTFTTQREELVRGRYRVAVREDAIAERWAAIERTIAEQYPALRLVRSAALRAGTERGAREAQGDGEPAAGDVSAWATSFVNPDTQALEVRIFTMRAPNAASDEWVMVVDYLGFAGR